MFYLKVPLIDYVALKCELTTMSTLYRTESQDFLEFYRRRFILAMYRHFSALTVNA